MYALIYDENDPKRPMKEVLSVHNAEYPVPGGLSLGGNDRQVFSDHGIHQGGFPDIGPPHDGNDSGHSEQLRHKGSVMRTELKSKNQLVLSGACVVQS